MTVEQSREPVGRARGERIPGLEAGERKERVRGARRVLVQHVEPHRLGGADLERQAVARPHHAAVH